MEKDAPDIKLDPIIIIAVYVAAANLLKWVYPFSVQQLGSLAYIGYVALAIGLGIIFLAFKEFSKAEVRADCATSSKVLVATGIYKYSRNPMYLGFFVNFIGIYFLFNNLWYLILLIPAYVLFRFMVIAKEEEYLAAKFGDEYSRYKSSVRRWI